MWSGLAVICWNGVRGFVDRIICFAFLGELSEVYLSFVGTVGSKRNFRYIDVADA